MTEYGSKMILSYVGIRRLINSEAQLLSPTFVLGKYVAHSHANTFR